MRKLNLIILRTKRLASIHFLRVCVERNMTLMLSESNERLSTSLLGVQMWKCLLPGELAYIWCRRALLRYIGFRLLVKKSFVRGERRMGDRAT
jgi:hypothetical protein